jgi:uncharacterized membrane protein YsdA (DUF1294 family)/cold shock CspA family protein
MAAPIRMAGRIVDWNDDKGFGFVVPNGGGDRTFVHVNAFARGSRRPVEGDVVSYLPGTDPRGRLNARQVRHSGTRTAARATGRRLPRAALGGGALVAIAAAAVLGLLPAVLALAYMVMSGVSYLMYWADKSAAQRGGRRTPESSLHLADLLGGWPGALLAQQRLRHKTIKQPFQAIFWLVVIANVLAAGWLVASGIADDLAQALVG